jgi:predicted RNA-binding protein with RPS1 domain
MNTRNNNSDSNSSQPKHLASPFAALTMDDGKIALTTTGEAPVKIEKTQVISPALPKTPARNPIAMPARRKTPSLLGTRTTVQTSTAVKTPVAVETPAVETSTTLETPVAVKTPEAPAPAPVALTGWDLLVEHQKKGTVIRGHVTRVIASKQDNRSIVGVKVRVAGLDGFVPFRMLGLSPLETEHSVTLEMGFRVMELEKGMDGAKDRIILNRQLVVTQEKSATLLQSVKVGDCLSGTIRNIKPFGAFLDINGASAMIHVNDLPQGNTNSVKIGQQVTVQVVKVDKAKNQLGVSIKHYFVSQLVVGSEFTGPVKNEETFGVFVQLNETVDGLVHVSQFGDFSPVRGNIATVKVIGTNTEKGQVQLALLGLTDSVAQAS